MSDAEGECFCGGERDDWQYHTPEGCGDTAQALQFVRGGRSLRANGGDR